MTDDRLIRRQWREFFGQIATVRQRTNFVLGFFDLTDLCHPPSVI
jgi:hypothetical protein